MATEDAIRARIAEHETAIGKNREMLQGMQEQAQTLMVDIERRRGAIAECIAMLQANGQTAPAQPTVTEKVADAG